MNIWDRFSQLLPKDTKVIAEINSGPVNDLYRLLLIDGAVIEARSTAAFSAGDKVVVRNGVIEGRAPDLPVVTILV